MDCGHWEVGLRCLMWISVLLAGAVPESERTQPPTFEIIQREMFLSFRATPPKDLPQCWKYMFQYRKCNENPVNENVSEHDNWTAEVEYDAACKYTVQVQAIYDEQYCLKGKRNSEMSKPVFFGQDGDLNLPFKVAMIIIPVIVCACLIIAIVLFTRHKDKFFPRVPSPSHFLKDMFDENKEMTKGFYVQDLYVPNEEVVESVRVEPNGLISETL